MPRGAAAEQALRPELAVPDEYTYSKDIDYVDHISNAGLGGQPTSNPIRFNFGIN